VGIQDLAIQSSVSNHLVCTAGETNIVSSSQTPATNFLPPQPILALAKKTKATCDNPAVRSKRNLYNRSHKYDNMSDLG
jgi:hypothetical protein